MRKLFLSVLVLLLCGCSVPGLAKFRKSGDKFECVEVEIPRENLHGAEIQRLEDRLNER